MRTSRSGAEQKMTPHLGEGAGSTTISVDCKASAAKAHAPVGFAPISRGPGQRLALGGPKDHIERTISWRYRCGGSRQATRPLVTYRAREGGRA
jgi:hypothetical protein